jgi:hypothetical protein
MLKVMKAIVAYMVAFVKRVRTALGHQKMMMTSPIYRLAYSTQTIHALPIWQQALERTPMTSDECAMLQIAEAKDVPYEVWNELLKDKSEGRALFQGLSERVGTRKHDTSKCARMALEFFIDGNNASGLFAASKHAEAIIEDAGLCMPPGLFVGADDLLKH